MTKINGNLKYRDVFGIKKNYRGMVRYPRSADSGKLPLLFLGLKVQDQGAAMGIWFDL